MLRLRPFHYPLTLAYHVRCKQDGGLKVLTPVGPRPLVTPVASLADSPIQMSNFARDRADTPETYSPPTNL